MTPADKGFQIPERKDAPGVEDPAIVAGKEAEAAKAAWMALPHATPEDEETPEFKAAEKRWHQADQDLATAPVTSIAGMLFKLRALIQLIKEDEPPDSEQQGHAETIFTFLEGFTGTPSVVGDDPAVVAFAELKAAWAALEPLLDEEEHSGKPANPECDAAYNRFADARDAVRDAVPVSLAGVAGKVRALLEPYRADADAVGLDPDYDISANAMLPFLEGAPVPAPMPDPVVVFFSQWEKARAKAKSVSSIQRAQGKEAMLSAEVEMMCAKATTVGGIYAKLRLFEYRYDPKHKPIPFKTVDDLNALSWEHRHVCSALLDAKRLAEGIRPEPDPVAVLFEKWAVIRDEATALSAAMDAAGPKGTDYDELNGRWENALTRCDAVEDQIMETPATSMRGVAIKIRLASHYVFEAGDLYKRHATPARDIDYVEADPGSGASGLYVVSALRDAERLAGGGVTCQ